jgi:hypothetical protein
VDNLWTEFAAHHGDLANNEWERTGNPNKLVVAATFEMAKA